MQRRKSFKIMMLTAVNIAMLILLADFCGVKSYAINLGENGEKISVLQKCLADKGYYSGEINGLLDFGTRKAVKNFKKQHSINDDDDYRLFSALGIYKCGYECFGADVEILARHLKINGIIGYHNMVEVCEKIIERAESTSLFSEIISASENTDKIINAKPDSEQYSAAFHVLNRHKKYAPAP